jgi:hypothetical protein
MRSESAVAAAREYPLAFEEHHSRGNLLHAVGPDWASSLQFHGAQFQRTARNFRWLDAHSRTVIKTAALAAVIALAATTATAPTLKPVISQTAQAVLDGVIPTGHAADGRTQLWLGPDAKPRDVGLSEALASRRDHAGHPQAG